MKKFSLLRISQVTALLLIFQLPTYAQHSDILVQSAADRLINGTGDPDNQVYVLGTRSYSREFDSDYVINDPGWNALGSNLPAGAEALPAFTGLEFDFLPMKIDGLASNFFYWDGSGSVDFGATPNANYRFALETFSSGLIIIDGSPALQPGAVFDNTDNLGAIHTHRDWEVADLSGGVNPLDGIYLVAMRTRMNTLDRSMPFYLVFGTPGSTASALTTAQAWVDAHLDELSPDFSADFDGDLDVDADDLATFEAGYGNSGSAALQIAGDANFDDVVDGRDFLAWQRQVGSSLASFSGTSTAVVSTLSTVPEPGSSVLVLTAAACLFPVRRQGRLAKRNRLW